jgi:nucleoside-diphosphate-sugar epimerase
MLLVTGATGFFGINQVKELLEKGEKVLALDLDDFPTSVRRFFTDDERQRLHFVSCDIRDRKAVQSVFDNNSIERVIHAGAVTVLASEDEEKARLVMEVNACGTFNLLDAAHRAGIKRFVYVSSSGVYGSRGGGVVPLHESTPYDPMGLYVAAKIYSELLCRRFDEFGKMRVAVARIGSPYGPWERPTGTRRVMGLIHNLLQMGFLGKEVLLYGADSVRDWTHMRDIARATTALAFCDDYRLRNLLYNVTTGQNVSTGRIAEVISRILPSFSYRTVDAPGEANVNAHLPNPRGPLDITRLRQDCEFEPVYDIESGLEDYVTWYAEYVAN